MSILLSIKEVAEILDVSVQTLRRWDQNGKLTALRHPVNNYRMYRQSDVEALLL